MYLEDIDERKEGNNIFKEPNTPISYGHNYFI